MLSHETVWAAIDNLAKRNGLTPSGLARRAGLDPTTFNKSKRFAPDGRPRWPSTESISKILSATNSDLNGMFLDRAPAGGTAIAPAQHLQIRIPVIGTAIAGTPDGAHADTMVVSEEVLLFPRADEYPVYAFRVSGRSMEPVYHDGDVLMISMSSRVRRGDRVVMQTRDGDVLVKVFKRKTANELEFQAVDPASPGLTIPRESVEWMGRVIWATQ